MATKKNENGLRTLESSIIPIYEGRAVNGDKHHEQLVNARELWEGLESKTQFADWIKDRIERYGFELGTDYYIFSEKTEKRGRPQTEYILRLDTAKEIAMVENNTTGKQIRRYFIEAEKRYRSFAITRAQSKAERRLFTDVLKEVLPESPSKKWAFKYYTDLVYKIVTGENAKQLRELHKLPQDANVRNVLTPEQLKEVIKYERIIESLLELGQDYDGVKAILNNPKLLKITS